MINESIKRKEVVGFIIGGPLADGQLASTDPETNIAFIIGFGFPGVSGDASNSSSPFAHEFLSWMSAGVVQPKLPDQRCTLSPGTHALLFIAIFSV
jgi:hypothetical protein